MGIFQQFGRLLFIAAVAGSLAAIVLTLAQGWTTQPLLLSAELYEHGLPATTPLSQDQDRIAFRFIANILSGIAFGLILAAAMTWRNHKGILSGLAWGLAGWTVFMALPAIGLPPELPGSDAAPLVLRQLWWSVAVATGAIGLGLIILYRRFWSLVAGVLLIILPHIAGAPEPEHAVHVTPQSLRDSFIIATLLVTLGFWLLLGGLTGLGLKSGFRIAERSLGPAL